MLDIEELTAASDLTSAITLVAERCSLVGPRSIDMLVATILASSSLLQAREVVLEERHLAVLEAMRMTKRTMRARRWAPAMRTTKVAPQATASGVKDRVARASVDDEPRPVLNERQKPWPCLAIPKKPRAAARLTRRAKVVAASKLVVAKPQALRLPAPKPRTTSLVPA